jgi:hypothetical protein
MAEKVHLQTPANGGHLGDAPPVDQPLGRVLGFDPELVGERLCGGSGGSEPDERARTMRRLPDSAQPSHSGRLAGPSREGDILQHLRQVLPCEVRVTAETHPLFGRLLNASGFKRRNGVLFLVVGLPDGSPGTIRADATSAYVATDTDTAVLTVFSVEGLRELRRLTASVDGRRLRDAFPSQADRRDNA